jgi:hypothetical protein
LCFFRRPDSFGPHSGSRLTLPPTNPRGACDRPTSRPPPKYGAEPRAFPKAFREKGRSVPEGAAVPKFAFAGAGRVRSRTLIRVFVFVRER